MGSGLPLWVMSTAHDDEEHVIVDAAVPDPSDAQPTARSKPRKKLFHRRAQLITSAQRSAAENRRSRETKYLIMQGLRIPFVLLSIAAVLWWNNWWLAILFFCISIPLPWISVVVANDSNEKRDTRTQNVYKPAAVRHQMLVAQQQAQLTSGSAEGNGADGTDSTDSADPNTIDHVEGV